VQQHELRPPKGATHKRKRVGRGNASGHGTYATKGLKGQKARSGGGVRPGFEGGQLPLVRRMAYKRGFRNPFRVDYEEVNVGALAAFAAGTEVNGAALRESRLVRTGRPIKILGEGELTVALTVEADRFSKSAKEKIEAAGGTVRWLHGEPPPKEEKKPRAAAKPTADEATAPKVSRKSKAPPAGDDAPKSEANPEAPAGQEEATDGAGS
jgi:large subunit ribosomal protein L15